MERKVHENRIRNGSNSDNKHGRTNTRRKYKMGMEDTTRIQHTNDNSIFSDDENKTEERKGRKGETEEEIKRKGVERKSRARRIQALLKRHEKWMKADIRTTQFKEPVMFFIRTSGEIEFYESVTAGLFEYKHSNGEQQFIIVNPTTQYKFGFADRKFRGYIAHENNPITGYPDPYITAEQVNIIVEKSINDMKKWKAEVLKETQGIIKWVVYGIIGVILAYAIFRILTDNPAEATQVVTMAKDTAVIVANQTPTIIP